MKFIKTLLIIYSVIFLHVSYASISLGSTRVVISDGKNEGTVNVHNRDDSNYLIQSWVLDKNEKITEDFALTPPIFKLNEETSNSLRILLLKDLPQDKESLYWLNVKFIPSTNKNDNKNKLTFAINNQIKIIYRPKSISGNDMMAEFKKITMKKLNDNIEINNPTNHYMSFSEIKADGVILKTPSYVEPGTRVNIPVTNKAKTSKIEYILIDDLGKLNSFEVNI